MILRLSSFSWICAGLMLAPSACTVDLALAAQGETEPVGAIDWLVKISSAARRLDYEGIFVYLHGNQLETMRIVHKTSGGRSRERLVSLNGAPREIIRDDKTVFCYLPDEKSVVVEHRKVDKQNFPAILPDRMQDLEANYRIELGPSERIAGRMTQQIAIVPRDNLRYGFRLWADRASGLLMKADLLSEQGETLEQFLFTNLSVGIAIPDSVLEPDKNHVSHGLTWHRAKGSGTESMDGPGWRLNQIPRGFRLTDRQVRRIPQRDVPVEHHVYSDGLATVSVFIEKADKPAPRMEGVSRIGAVNAFGARVSDFQITAVGEVPEATVSQFAKSVVPPVNLK